MAQEDPNRQRARQILEGHRGKKGALLVALLDIQYEMGYIPEASIQDAAEVLGHSEAEVWGVLTFYADFKIGRDGGHFIDVCVDGPCHVAGAERIREALETWRKGQGNRPIQIRTISCPGMCSTAPIIAVDMQYFAKATPESAVQKAGEMGKAGQVAGPTGRSWPYETNPHLGDKREEGHGR